MSVADLRDGAAVGNVFASPSADQMLAVIKEIDGGAGVLLLYGNYGGDVMNFGLAAELAAAEGIEVADCRGRGRRRLGAAEARRRADAASPASSSSTRSPARSAAAGSTLDQVRAVTERAAGGLRSMGVALSPCTVPAAGRPTFELPAGEMEIGMGIHGEPGVRRGPLETADEVADQLVDALLARPAALVAATKVDVLVNGLGATPPEELYILFRRVHARLADVGLHIRRTWIGEYATSLEMAGASYPLLRVDDELAELLDAPASAPLLARV